MSNHNAYRTDAPHKYVRTDDPSGQLVSDLDPSTGQSRDRLGRAIYPLTDQGADLTLTLADDSTVVIPSGVLTAGSGWHAFVFKALSCSDLHCLVALA